MSELQFPKYPIVGQEYDFPPYRYYWDGIKWKTKGIGYNPVNDLRDELEPKVSNNESKVFEALKRSYADAGFNLVEGSFEEGGQLLVASDVMITASGDGYSWGGPEFPHNVAKGTDPTLPESGYVSLTDVVLRDEITLSVTAASVANLSLSVGSKVVITDRNYSTYEIVSGGTPDGFAIIDAGNSNTAVYRPSSEFVVLEDIGIESSPSFDIVPVLTSGASIGSKLKAVNLVPYYLGSEFRYPRNCFSVVGSGCAPYTTATIFRPMETFSGASLFDLNENGSDGASEGGQYNTLENCRIDGGMLDYANALDPKASLIGVRGLRTRNETRLINVSFRACGKPFTFTGYQHKFKKIDIFQCHTAGDMESTNSSVIDDYNILTCYKNWGVMTGVEIRNAVLQQGNERQKLVDDIGIRCSKVNFTGSLYTEGGNAQIYVEDGSWVNVHNATLGFAVLTSGSYGNYNIRVGIGSSIRVKGGRSTDTKSFLVGGGLANINGAKEIHLDIEPNDSRLFDFADGTQLPKCENLFVRRSYATLDRKNGYNEITYNTYQVDTSLVTLWNQFTSSENSPFGGEIKIQCAGQLTYDQYNVNFADCPGDSPQVAITTVFRNTGGTGTHNVVLNYTAPSLTLQGRQSPQRIGMKISAFGSMWPKPIS